MNIDRAETWREFMEREAKEFDPLDREYAAKRLCGPRAVKKGPPPLPLPSIAQVEAKSWPIYRALVDLMDAVSSQNSDMFTCRVSMAWSRACNEIRRAADWEPPKEEVDDAVA